ncbi:MAG: VWA domain-containing protein, partial [Bacteroidota bacterium]
ASITSRRNPVSLRVPDAPGTYELRYVTRQLKRVLATRPITVEGVPTSLDAPTQAQIGEEIEVTWDGPGNQYDLVALFEAGAPDDAKPAAAASIVSRQNPVSLKLPEAGGAYELRYMTAQSKTVLARRAIQIGEVAASLDAPDAATAGTRIDVSWTGPGNDYDLIGVFETSAPETAEPLAGNTILSGRNPIRVRLPESNGSYELRYRTRQSKRVLARRPIEIGPAGQIEVVYERATTTTASEGVGAVALILDASGSMLKRENGVRRIEIAKQVLDELVREGLQDEQPFALRVFGHKEADACRTDLELPLRPLDREQAASAIAGVNAMNLAKTPIAASLALVPSDLAGASGPKTIVLITDGEETCEGDPEAVIRDLRARGLDVRVSVVGFAIDDADLRSEFEGWADLGGGAYFDARSAEDLSESLRTVLSGPFSVLDASGTVVAEGVIGGAPVRVPAGVYRIATAGQSAAASDVRVTAGDVTRVEL